MTDYNEFNWNEEGTFSDESNNSAPLYTENVLKPKAKKKKSSKKLILGVICGALVGSLISTTAVIGIYTLNTKNGGVIRVYESSRKNNSGGVTKVSTSVNDSEEELTTSEIAQAVGPAVVGISCTVSYQNYFFGGVQQGTSSGSGIVYSDQGHIITNYHVIENAKDITVKFSNGNEYPAQLVGGDQQSDLAVIKIDPVDELKVAVMGDSDRVEVGDRAIAIGNPLGDELFGTVTQGIISGKNRTVQVDDRQMTLLQTDAAINPGNSGGALINAYGEVIGINSVKIASSVNGTSSEGLGFAIPINEAMPIVNDLIEVGYVRGRPLIGVTVQSVTSEMAEYYHFPKGLYVLGVTENGAADQAGIQRGDIILSMDGEDVLDADGNPSSTKLNSIRDRHKAGETVKVEIDRNGEKMTIDLTLMEDSSAKVN